MGESLGEIRELERSLGPCPFKGCDSPRRTLVKRPYMGGFDCWRVECGCGARGSTALVMFSAVQRWNDRA